jgi:CRP-like cAMP-binding protein
MTLVTKTGVIY